MVQDLIAEAFRVFRGVLGSHSPAIERSGGEARPSRAVFPSAADPGVDALILTLAADLRPTVFRPLLGRLTAAAGLGILIAILFLGAAKGFRPWPMEAAMAMAASVKAGYALTLGAPSLLAAARLASPERHGEAWHAWIAWPVALLAAVAFGQWLGAPAAARSGMLLGSSAQACPSWIVEASLPSLVGLIRIMRTQAPTRPALTGALLGLAAGAAGAGAYALFCPETSLGFIAIWYTAGLASMVALGALLGSWLLRW